MCLCDYRGRQHGASEPDGVTLHVMCDDLNLHGLWLQTDKNTLACGWVETFRFVRVVSDLKGWHWLTAAWVEICEPSSSLWLKHLKDQLREVGEHVLRLETNNDRVCTTLLCCFWVLVPTTCCILFETWQTASVPLNQVSGLLWLVLLWGSVYLFSRFVSNLITAVFCCWHFVFMSVTCCPLCYCSTKLNLSLTFIRPPLSSSLSLSRASTTLLRSLCSRRPKSLNMVDPPDNTMFWHTNVVIKPTTTPVVWDGECRWPRCEVTL